MTGQYDQGKQEIPILVGMNDSNKKSGGRGGCPYPLFEGMFIE